MNILQVHRVYWTEQRLEGNEAHGGVGLLQVPEARQGRVIFDGHSEPDMWGSSLVPVALLDEAAHQRTALGKHLIDMPIGALHGVEYALDVLGGNILVEEIAHRIDEDELWTPPLHGLFEAFGAKGQVEARLERVSLDATKTLRKALGIAMVATGANLRAAGDRVPSAVSPLDGAFARHERPLCNEKLY